MTKKLQVQIEGEWRWVFARNSQYKNPLTTIDKSKALNHYAKPYFEQHFANLKFRVK